MSDPWMKFYTSDWRSDPRLRMCSAGARGIWIDMICLMHEATPYGHLLVHGQTPNEGQLASLTGTPIAEFNDLVAELERMGVFSRTKEGVIYSRKLVRMAAKSAKARKIGKLGGNPTLGKLRENTQSVNLPLNGHDKPQSPEARSQIEEKIPSVSLRIARFEEFWTAYPHRNGAKKGKRPAEDIYRKAVQRGVAEQAIIDGAAASRQHPDVVKGFARDPATWLRQAGWEDQAGSPAPEIDRFRRIRENYA